MLLGIQTPWEPEEAQPIIDRNIYDGLFIGDAGCYKVVATDVGFVSSIELATIDISWPFPVTNDG
jgi:hypothetical protein